MNPAGEVRQRIRLENLYEHSSNVMLEFLCARLLRAEVADNSQFVVVGK